MLSKTQQGIVAVIVVIGLLGICFIALALFAPARSATVQPTAAIVPTATTQVYLLELLSSNSEKTTRKHFEVRGQVKNISSQSLESVQAVISIYDGGGTFIESKSWLIEFNPLLPGQVSPFKIIFDDGPNRERYNITFKQYIGGEIPTKDSR